MDLIPHSYSFSFSEAKVAITASGA